MDHFSTLNWVQRNIRLVQDILNLQRLKEGKLLTRLQFDAYLADAKARLAEHQRTKPKPAQFYLEN